MKLVRRRAADLFDTELGIETAKEVPLWGLEIPSENVKFGARYSTVEPPVFLRVVDRVSINRQAYNFVDLGCGKGRALVLAARMGFARVVGVEFSPELCTIARKNLTCAGAGADVVEGDASRYEFPDANLLIYMYNPFAEPVLDSVCDNLIHWRRKHAKEGYIAYLNPRHSACF
ncbi:MAG TPA: class I SAM-dependent methyltransferase, partial [Verrucomicrobiae bacterium]|nr:class I SAM-dependent methyltransferase [Verrucomicrobiae bacterium]